MDLPNRVIDPNDKERVASKGGPALERELPRGDLIITFDVIFPEFKSISAANWAKLKQAIELIEEVKIRFLYCHIFIQTQC